MSTRSLPARLTGVVAGVVLAFGVTAGVALADPPRTGTPPGDCGVTGAYAWQDVCPPISSPH
jgi:hypothetical protein